MTDETPEQARVRREREAKMSYGLIGNAAIGFCIGAEYGEARGAARERERILAIGLDRLNGDGDDR
jgi:hypothetical protein